MMKINITRIEQEVGGRQSFSFSVPAKSFNSEHSWSDEELYVEGEIINNGHILEVKGVVRGRAQYCCSRCLKEFIADRKIPFDQNFQKQSMSYSAEDDLTFYYGEEIDLSEIIRESILLSEPLKVLCSNNCRGLCPICGTNLNEKNCLCGHDNINPKFAVLQQILREKQ